MRVIGLEYFLLFVKSKKSGVLDFPGSYTHIDMRHSIPHHSTKVHKRQALTIRIRKMSVNFTQSFCVETITTTFHNIAYLLPATYRTTFLTKSGYARNKEL